jgi:PII-like signaling protein
MNSSFKLLRIYTDEAAYFGDRKVFEIVATRAQVFGVAGATVLQALVGFGHTHRTHRRHVLDDDRSVVIEIIDEDAKLRAFVETIADLEHMGPITLEAVEVLRWPPAKGD